GTKRLLISNEYSNRLVHRWRSWESSIMVGTNTALYDDPELTTRLWPGNSPVRVVVDMDLRLPTSLKIFGGDTRTIVFNAIKHEQSGPLLYYRVTNDVNLVHQVLNALYGLNIQSVLVEGGSRLLQSFIDEKAWDEARVITNDQLMIGAGLRAPQLACSTLEQEQTILNDRIGIFKPERN
ncbi:MAG TPA: RibD family protein, partial [Chitinophagaceae bacterium]|nr:RibD family protein [Chitinophagaceae bacterium]